MLSSIGIIGAFTGAIASLIFHSKLKSNYTNNKDFDFILKDLTEEELEELENYIEFIKYKRNKTK